MLEKNAPILLVEDDRVDVMTVQRALRKSDISNPLYVGRTALDALAMLRGEGAEKIDPPPVLILLDLNLPKMSGIEFLKELRADTALKSLRVIVLTSSNEPRDREAAFTYDVDDYVVKPHSFGEFTSAISTILSHWSPENE